MQNRNGRSQATEKKQQTVSHMTSVVHVFKKPNQLYVIVETWEKMSKFIMEKNPTGLASRTSVQVNFHRACVCGRTKDKIKFGVESKCLLYFCYVVRPLSLNSDTLLNRAECFCV